MRLAFRVVNVLIGLVTLASALAVLVSDLTIDGYREHYRDALWFVAAYCVVQAVMVVEFARDGRWVPWLVLAKTAAAYAFLASFLVVWPRWQAWTPARYVYQLFDWGDGTRVGLFALVFLGRGAFNTINAMYFTQHWWRPLRDRRPLLGRLVTVLPLAAIILSLWSFMQLLSEEHRTFSPQAQVIARTVFEGLDCATLRARTGETSTDLRRQGEAHYEVRIAYDCRMTRVVVRAEDGRLGAYAGARPECCENAPS